MDIWPARTEGHLIIFLPIKFDDGFRPHSGEFDQKFFEKSNSWGFARGDDRSWN